MKTPRLNFFRRTYLALSAFLMVLIILTPTIIKGRVALIREEFVEGAIIALLLVIEIFLSLIYEGEIKRWQKGLEEAWKHIGKTNLLMNRFKSALFEIKKYPENKKDLKYVFGVMAEKILGIANVDFVMFRVLDVKTMKTMSEYFQERGNIKIKKARVSNRELLEGRVKGFKIIVSQAKNVNIKTFCILPEAEIDEEQEIFINKIVDDFAMLYVIFGFYALQK